MIKYYAILIYFLSSQSKSARFFEIQQPSHYISFLFTNEILTDVCIIFALFIARSELLLLNSDKVLQLLFLRRH